jgi:tRNA G18 (ribose-2'-O)-methylase SpoU
MTRCSCSKPWKKNPATSGAILRTADAAPVDAVLIGDPRASTSTL